MMHRRSIWPAAAAAALFSLPASSAEGLKFPRTEVEAGYGHESLTNGRADWSLAHIDASRQIAERNTVYGSLREARRFGLHDSEAMAGFYYPLGATWTSVLEGSFSPSHRFLPRHSVFGQLLKSLGNGWAAGAGLRHSEYERSSVDILVGTVERYWGNWRGAYTVYSGRPEGAASGAAHRFQLTYYYGQRSSAGISLTNGKEVENVGPPIGVVTTNVRDLTFSGRHWLDDAWALTYELVSHEQGAQYRRRGLHVGVRHSF